MHFKSDERVCALHDIGICFFFFFLFSNEPLKASSRGITWSWARVNVTENQNALCTCVASSACVTPILPRMSSTNLRAMGSWKPMSNVVARVYSQSFYGNVSIKGKGAHCLLGTEGGTYVTTGA